MKFAVLSTTAAARFLTAYARKEEPFSQTVTSLAASAYSSIWSKFM